MATAAGPSVRRWPRRAPRRARSRAGAAARAPLAARGARGRLGRGPADHLGGAGLSRAGRLVVRSGGRPASPLANGGAFGGKVASPAPGRPAAGRRARPGGPGGPVPRGRRAPRPQAAAGRGRHPWRRHRHPARGARHPGSRGRRRRGARPGGRGGRRGRATRRPPSGAPGGPRPPSFSPPLTPSPVRLTRAAKARPGSPPRAAARPRRGSTVDGGRHAVPACGAGGGRGPARRRGPALLRRRARPTWRSDG